MNIISVDRAGKSFGIKPLFDEVSFGIDDGDRIGVIGANGSGKTTLLRIIAGEESADTGRVVTAKGRAIAYLSQHPPHDPDLTVIESALSGGNQALDQKLELVRQYEQACHDLAAQGGADERLLQAVSDLAARLEAEGIWQLENEARALLAELGISDLSVRMGELSGGQRKRVALARSLFLRPDLLILDEPTNHLDAETVEWLEEYLARYRGALLLVTHDRYFLDRVTNRIIEIDRGRVQSFPGNYAKYLEKKQEQEERLAVEARKLRQLARRELEWLRRGPKARTTKARARVDRALELIDQSKKLTGEIAARRSLDINFDSSRLGGTILSLEGISRSYGPRVVIRDFSYTFKRGDRIGIIGPNGAGKTTLLEIIARRLEPDSGSIEMGQTVVIGYYDQESREFDLSQRLIDYIRDVAEYITTAEGDTVTASQMLDRFLFPPAMQYQTIGSLSGGERRRLYLLRLLMGAPNLLLLDEVTNDLDIPTLNALEEYLENFPGCLVIVSHDRYFLDRTIDTVFRIETDGSIREYPGNYSAYREIREQETAPVTDPAPEVRTPTIPKSDQGKRKISFNERREFEELEARIAVTEARIAEIDAELAANSSDHVLVARLYEESEALKKTLDADLERWTELADLV
ncbi:MAG: ribosomal protection-like ABC-F family protein [Blastocatellales bacterium]